MQTLANFFTAENWPFVTVQDEQILQMAVGGQNEKLTCYAQVIEEQSLLIFYSNCPIEAPESQRQALAEFLTLINYDLIIGNFQLDLKSGQIRYKTSLDVSDSTLSTTQIKNLVYTNITMMDEYLPEILSVINNSSPPLDSIPFQKNFSTSHSSDKNSYIKGSKQIAAIQDKKQKSDFYRTLPQLKREATSSLPSEESEDVRDSKEAEIIQEKNQQLDFSPSLPQPDRETTHLSLDVEIPEDIECEQAVENYPDKDKQLQDTQTLFQPEPENSLPPSPLERSSDVEDSSNTENYQNEPQQFEDILTPSKIERENSHSFSISEQYEAARTTSQPPQDNSLTTTLTEQIDPTQQPEKFSLNPDVLSDLTEEETASFESAIQLIKTGKLYAAKTILAAVKNNMTGELGEEGEKIFYAANNLFLVTNLPPASINELNGYDKVLPPNVQNLVPILINPKLECNSIQIDYEFAEDGLVSQIYLQVGHKTVAKKLKSYFGTLKQIYRYWDISSQLKPLLEHVKNISTEQLKQSSQTTRDTLRASERLPTCIQTRLLQLAAEKLESQLEVDILIEIGELQELLAKTKRILNTEFL